MKKSQAITIFQTILIIVVILLKNNFVITREEDQKVFERWRAWMDGENMLAFTYLDIRDKKIAGL